MKSALFFLLALTSSLPVFAAGPLPNLWDNPVFQKHLLGSFGINSEIEPGYRDDNESADYEQIAKIMQTDADEAMKALQTLSKIEGASARVDFA
ncbi:MAG: hypothetical protein B7Z55_00485, partial [Planctomycetales bacterium 12-60-4]